MKARVNATGEIVEVKSKVITSPVTGKSLLKYVDQKTGISYFEEELFFPKDLADDPNYWTRLEHQAAIAAMQGALANNDLLMQLLKRAKSGSRITHVAVEFANACAHTFVEKMKEAK
jgi:hypothetical protein